MQPLSQQLGYPRKTSSTTRERHTNCQKADWAESPKYVNDIKRQQTIAFLKDLQKTSVSGARDHVDLGKLFRNA
jgi:hypothetical protein